MKKIVIVLACILGGITAKAQTGTTVVYIPQAGTCYEAPSISTSTNGDILTLRINNAVAVTPTKMRLAVANDCTRGEFQNDNEENGTHNVTCDTRVNVTCFCTGVK